ncbi:hypothetical protein [Bradyrhizobium sp. Ghvi]|nr:hypothetical protein [Bradyrhizobium sp. Ghvi]
MKSLTSAGRIALFTLVGAFVLVPLAQTIITSLISTLPRAGIAGGAF